MRSSNTSREGKAEQYWVFRWLLAGLAVTCLIRMGFALDPNQQLSQYIRDQWGAKQGFPGGIVYAIAETADGYLWIGTEKGLVRFDGLNFRLISDENSTAFPGGPVLGLTTDSAGNLWIRLQGAGLLRYQDGKFEDVLSGFEQRENGVTAMCRGINGDVLLSALVNGKVRFSGGKFISLASWPTLPNYLVISMAETADGTVWMGSRDAGLFSLSKGRLSNIERGLQDKKINCLLPIGSQELWIGTDNGVARWNGTELARDGVLRSLERIQTLALGRDRESNIWIGTANGLTRINAKGVLSSEKRGGAVTAIFEDREGNLWVGSTQGIERFRDSVFVTYPAAEGTVSGRGGPLYVDAEERTWFAASSGGLIWQKGTHSEHVKAAGLDNDVVYSIAGSNSGLWIGRQRGGLTHLGFKNGALTTRTYTQAEGLAQNSVYAVHQGRDGTAWAGTLNGGVSNFKNGSFTTYTTVNGLVSNTVVAIVEGSDGTMWFATPDGLSALSKSHWRSYTSRDGLPPGSVNCLLEDATGVLWIGTAKGIAFLSSGQIKTTRTTPDSLRNQVFGIAEDRSGWLWIATENHVVRVNRDKLLSGALFDGDVREYGLADGLPSTEGVKRHRSVVVDPSGRIWFSLNRGISVADPARLAGSSVPALVHILTVSADGGPIDLNGPVRLPAAPQRVMFSYAGVSLSAPERVRFRYRLDNFDRGWSEPVAAREAVYTNLSPGSYRFRVIATNSEGLWNGAEAVIGFEIPPLFWQTWWFRIAALLVCLLITVAWYRLRMRRFATQLNDRFEERLAERTRIAQELHDTLLQGFISASMQLHVAVDQMPEDLPAKERFGRVLQLMRQVIEEGRNAVRGLRSASSNSLDLEQAFARIQQELAIQEQFGFRVIVEGRQRSLPPILQDEVYLIGREALVNAF
ncbi:MAG TPA: two-component regulator propeller domain-containing protein, partial [Candidatus Angelobacter sp.]|nr:two-component regulator propeller domain-containing protein [Candidatus Angelobacter sp.]